MAKGLAHIGILCWAIDSAGLKIDYVTGTRTGSIVALPTPSVIRRFHRGHGSQAGLEPAFLQPAQRLRTSATKKKAEYNRYMIEIPFG